MVAPSTEYTKSGDLNIAYQVFGSGTIDLVYVPGWVSNIDLMWACPELVAFFVELGKTFRVILFDKRGTGLSDRVVELSTLEERMDDIKAVMDAAKSERAVLFGHSEGGSASALYSVTYPNRVISLIAFGVFAKRRYAIDYPWAPTDEERQKVYDMIENNWCSGEMLLETLAPSKANDTKFMNWLASYFRSGASPNAAMKLTKMNTEVDVVDILGYIRVPTLLMQRTHDIDVKIEEGKFIAKHIRGSKFVEFDGEDHLFWVGNTKGILKEMTSFVKDIKPNTIYKNGLATILFGQFIASLKSGVKLDIIEQYVKEYNGEIIQLDQKNFAVSFEQPSKAAHCSLALLEALQEVKTSLAMGIYIKEGIIDSHQYLEGLDFYTTNAILSQLQPNQILATQTVKHLLSGSSVNFSQKTSILNYASNSICKLYSIDNDANAHRKTKSTKSPSFLNYDSFLEDVLQIIDENIENDVFGVDILRTKMRMSERQLQRKIKETTNKSPNQLISSIRLNKAKKILIATDLSIAEIAFKFGFSSPSYFSKCFKKEFNINPNSLNQKV